MLNIYWYKLDIDWFVNECELFECVYKYICYLFDYIVNLLLLGLVK